VGKIYIWIFSGAIIGLPIAAIFAYKHFQDAQDTSRICLFANLLNFVTLYAAPPREIPHVRLLVGYLIFYEPCFPSAAFITVRWLTS
jgi:hypothetical protein